MEFYQVLKTRRSIRKFRKSEVTSELVEKLIAAAMLAPSAGNQQSWQFIVIRDREKLDAVPAIHPYCTMIKQVPVAILVCGDPAGKKWPDFWVQDCSAATQNLLLAARAEGLGTVWTGIYPLVDRMKGCRNLFSIPDHIIPFALIPVGWAEDEGFKETSRFKPELIHEDVFVGK
ncbi:MAG: nitroreductase family protein [Desulfobacterales bacterium]|nr:nitroreductase family protein [Deltaproteobacteria bacterium]MBT8359734.1 nitroreductase family protein [Deltaproteobacteria bacterium]NNK93309.1 nitroreductase family protein [Desulfobacterales bacterium]